jgi:hypothetical protein
VRIDWQGPLSLAAALQHDTDDDCGLYLVEGHYMLYGCKGALYLGSARDQPFAARIAQHRWWIDYEQDVSIRLGRLRREDYKEEPPDWNDWYRLVGDVEAFTIHWHAFPYNSDHILDYHGQPLRVQNLGKHGNLQIEYSTDWNPPRPPADPE